ncbi:hypothetical protein J7T55_004117 [Diaporthe amygdali]|uniref:uncharacterized protein n=1 Tax=Phomopsis amygdali TaxID=1214568 RepID=UPI0022FE3C00|nr:uncharacterized protein J7T55_004117 [Diaporthe amygdali]KAJ0115947.1 hypothetical protein J7T55_004117 [Diaporthe amygdali]
MMIAPVLLAALAGTAVAIPTPQVEGDGITYSNWTVRADWSRCPDASLFDITLQGRIAVTGTTSGTGIVDFKLPVAPFEASLVLKPAGSIGFGSPRPPKMVDIALLETADADGNWGTATFQPEKVGATSVDAAIAQVAWFTTPDQAFMPASELDYSTLQKNQTATIGTTVDPSFLRVYYCYHPEF